jgi:lysophospholipase L1-like esterase
MDDHPPRRRFSRGVGALLELSVAVVLTAALLTVIEVGAGRFLRDTTAEERMSTAFAHARGDTVETTLMTLSMNPVPLVADRELLWRNQPGAQRDVPANPRGIGRPETWHVAIDRSGYRGPDRSSGVESGPVYRILCIGDSITYGWGTDQDDVFPRRVEAILRERHPGADIEVTNAGVPEWSWIQGLRFLEREGLALRPDVVVMGHGTNDQLKDTRTTDLENLGGSTAWSHAIYRARNILGDTNTFRALERFRGHPIPGPSRACRKQIARYGLCQRVSLEEIESAVHDVAQLTAKNGIDLLLINVDFMHTRAIEASRAVADREHLRLIDFVERFDSVRMAREDARRARFGLAPARVLPSHPSTEGNRSLVLRVHVPGAPAKVTVEGRAYGLDELPFNAPMFDDGTHGDERPHDGVYSTTIEVPARFRATEYKFIRDGEMEFTPLPPLPPQHGARLLMGTEDRIAPVEDFAELYLMVEQAHPDREGHALIADALADEVEALPSFQRYIDRVAPTGPAPVDTTR